MLIWYNRAHKRQHGYPLFLPLYNHRETGRRGGATPRQKCVLHKTDYPPDRDYDKKRDESPTYYFLSFQFARLTALGEDKLSEPPKERQESDAHQHRNERINKT